MTDGNAIQIGEEDESSAFSLSPASQPHPHPPRQFRPREPPQLERAVISRTRFHISLPTAPPRSGASKTTPVSEVEQRGWSSPHGEPYRPLGRPELNLKFSPQLAFGVSPMMHNTHRTQGSSSGAGGATGTGSSSNSEKAVELRGPSTSSSTSNTGVSMTTLVDQFVTSITKSERVPDERQVKLAQRLQANVNGFSPERVKRLGRRKPLTQEQEQQQPYQTSHSDTSLRLLRKAINEGVSRLRLTRNGTNFLQTLPPSSCHGLHELHEQYLRARTQLPQPGMNGGARTSCSPRMMLGLKTTYGEIGTRSPATFNRDEDVSLLASSENEDGQGTWYLPYTTRQLQRSPHRQLSSLRSLTRDEKQSSRAVRASRIIKTNPPPHKTRRSTAPSNHASMASVRASLAPALHSVMVNGNDNTVLPPFVMATASSTPTSSVPPLHSVEKLQAAVDALEATKCQQSARLATTLEILDQDRRECLAGKFRSLHVHSDVVEDLRRMRERSERRRGLAAVSSTADWYSDLLRRILARDSIDAGSANSNTGGLLPLHAAEYFIVQAVRRLTSDGYEFQSTQLFQVILHLHRDDLQLLQVQQLLVFLRNAMGINHEEWTRFFAAHGMPEPVDNSADSQGVPDGKSGFLRQPRHE